LRELQKLGFAVSETTVSRYVRRFRAHNPDPDVLKRWVAFLRNHRVIAAMDLFTVPTATMNVLYGFFVVHHDRRHILHFNATYHPTAEWVMQQLREAFPFESAPRHFIFDRDSIFCPAVVEFVKALGVEPNRTAYRSPWQNPVSERWVGTIRRELLDHVVVLSERHLVALVTSFLRYYHEDRCHLGLTRDTLDQRPVHRGRHLARRLWRCRVSAGCITDTCGERLPEAARIRVGRETPPAASTDLGAAPSQHSHSNEPIPQTFAGRLVWLVSVHSWLRRSWLHHVGALGDPTTIPRRLRRH